MDKNKIDEIDETINGHVNYLSFVDEDIRKFFESYGRQYSYNISDPLTVQLVKTMRTLCDKLDNLKENK